MGVAESSDREDKIKTMLNNNKTALYCKLLCVHVYTYVVIVVCVYTYGCVCLCLHALICTNIWRAGVNF